MFSIQSPRFRLSREQEPAIHFCQDGFGDAGYFVLPYKSDEFLFYFSKKCQRNQDGDCIKCV